MRKISMNLDQLADAIKPVAVHGNLDVMVSGLCRDSRIAREGDLFVALPGEHVDGSLFIPDAVRRGACAVVCEQRAKVNNSSVPLIVVDNAHRAAAFLASRFFDHPAKKLTLVGITGTNGKTTTTRLLESILARAGYAVASIGTLAYRWAGSEQPAKLTTPDPIQFHNLLCDMVNDGVTHVVMEVSSHALSLDRVAGCQFRLAVFTNLSRDHLDFHGNLEGYFEAKATLFKDYLSRNVGNDPVAIINVDDPYGLRLIPQVAGQTWSYSLLSENADIRVADMELSPAGIRAKLITPRDEMILRSALVGRLNLYNIVAAASAALALGVSGEAIIDGIRAVEEVTGRLQRIPNDLGYDVVVDYAHTPDAMEKSLECLREITSGRLWVVFGCGGDRDRGKRPLMGRVAARYGDIVVVTSDNPRSESPLAIIEDIIPGVNGEGMLKLEDSVNLRSVDRGYLVEPDRKRAIEWALKAAHDGDLIFIGGKGHETYQIIGDRTLPFDDRKVVEDYLKR